MDVAILTAFVPNSSQWLSAIIQDWGKQQSGDHIAIASIVLIVLIRGGSRLLKWGRTQPYLLRSPEYALSKCTKHTGMQNMPTLEGSVACSQKILKI